MKFILAEILWKELNEFWVAISPRFCADTIPTASPGEMRKFYKYYITWKQYYSNVFADNESEVIKGKHNFSSISNLNTCNYWKFNSALDCAILISSVETFSFWVNQIGLSWLINYFKTILYSLIVKIGSSLFFEFCNSVWHHC